MPEDIQAVAVKLPQFWPADPDLWFAQAEAEFTIKKITADETKYSYLVAALPQETARRVRDVLKSPPEANKYESLKRRLETTFLLSETDRANRLLEIGDLGDRKPTELMDEIQALCGDHAFCLLAKQIFINALPQAIRLQMNDVDFDDPQEAARKADELWSTVQHQDKRNNTVSAVSVKSKRTQPADTSSQTPLADNSTASQGFCFFHKRFGNEAYRCKGPCTHPLASKPNTTTAWVARASSIAVKVSERTKGVSP